MTFLELLTSLSYVYLVQGKLPWKSLLQISSIQLIDIPLAPLILPIYLFYRATGFFGILFMAPPVLVILWFVRYFFAQSSQRQELAELLEVVDELISSTLNFGEMAQKIAQKMKSLFRSDGVDFFVNEKGGMKFLAAEGKSPWQNSTAKNWVLEREIIPDEPALYTDIRGNPHFSPYHAAGLFSLMIIPVSSIENKLGFFICSKGIPSYFYASHLNLAKILARRLGPALLSAKLHEEVLSTLEQLKATQSQLVQSEKMAGLGKLAAGVAHEINNPLGAILLNADLLTQNPGNEKALGNIRQSTTRCKEIAERLLYFSRQARPEREIFSISQILQESVKLWEQEMENAGIKLELNLLGEPEISGSPHEFFQVISNLVSNARDAIAQTGKLDGRIKVSVKETGEGVRVEVEDNGCGMPGEIVSKIFDPFFTTKEIGKGTGLGLSVSYGIVSAMGGKIEVESKEGLGTTFVLTFPKAASKAKKSALIERGLRDM